jgi:hypothetical protein
LCARGSAAEQRDARLRTRQAPGAQQCADRLQQRRRVTVAAIDTAGVDDVEPLAVRHRQVGKIGFVVAVRQRHETFGGHVRVAGDEVIARGIRIGEHAVGGLDHAALQPGVDAVPPAAPATAGPRVAEIGKPRQAAAALERERDQVRARHRVG